MRMSVEEHMRRDSVVVVAGRLIAMLTAGMLMASTPLTVLAEEPAVQDAVNKLDEATGAGNSEIQTAAEKAVDEAIANDAIPTKSVDEVKATVSETPKLAQDYVDAIDAVSDVKEAVGTVDTAADQLEGQAEKVQKTAEQTGSTADTSFNNPKDYEALTAEKVQDAQAAAQEASEALQKALNVTENSDGSAIEYDAQGHVDNTEIQEAVQKAKDAAAKADVAVSEAKSITSEAQTELKNVVEAYNAEAEAKQIPVKYVAGEDEDGDGQPDSYSLQETILSDEQKTALQEAKADVEAAATKLNDANKNYEAAKALAQKADEAVQAATTLVSDTTKDHVSKQKTAIDNLSEPVATVNKEYETAKSDYDAAVKRLNELENSIKKAARKDALLADLEKKAQAAQTAVNKAKKKLEEAEKAAESAHNSVDWTNALANKQFDTQAYTQATVEDGKKVPVDANVLEYDMENGQVKSRPTTDFIKVSKDGFNVKVPYNLYRAYVYAMTQGTTVYKYTEVANQKDATSRPDGKGAALGTKDRTVYYWELDENGKLTGVCYPVDENGNGPDEMQSGKYFVGYVLKAEKEGYHLDGFEVNYVKPEPEPEPEPEPTPEPTPNPNPTPTPGGEDTPTGGETSPVEPTTAAVLGVSRPQTDTAAVESDEPQVLGVSRDEPQVLGVGRNVPTGDEADQMMWAAIAMISAMLLSGWVVLHRRYNK